MASGKRYYWIKFSESFMASDEIDYLMEQKNGATYVVLYQMLCLKTVNTGGRLVRRMGDLEIPYDAEKIARDFRWISVPAVRSALKLFRTIGLIEEDEGGCLTICGYDGMIGSETDWAQKRRRQRDAGGDAGGDNVPPNVPENVPPNVPENVPQNVPKNVPIENERIDIRYNSFNHSIAREGDGAADADSEAESDEERAEAEAEANARKRHLLGGIGKDVVLLSEAEIADLFDKLSLDEFEHYVGVVADAELSGKHYRKMTHYQAILSMAMHDRGG